MAVKRGSAASKGRRINLARPGSKGEGNKISKKEVKKAKNVHIPWGGIKASFSTAALLSVLVIAIVGVSFTLVYAYRYLTTSDYFALQIIEINGNSRLDSREILESADLLEGANTLALSIDDIEESLSKNPWIQSVSVKRVLPGTLSIEIKELNPSFLVVSDGLLYFADARGKIIDKYVPVKAESFPTLEIEQGAEELAVMLPALLQNLKESQLPLNMKQISSVRLSAARGIEVYAEDSRLKISIGLEDWARNLERLKLTMDDLKSRGELQAVREIKAQGSNVWVEKTAAAAANGNIRVTPAGPAQGEYRNGKVRPHYWT